MTVIGNGYIMRTRKISRKNYFFIPRNQSLRKCCDCSSVSITDMKEKSEINKRLCYFITNIMSSDSKVTVRLPPVLLVDFFGQFSVIIRRGNTLGQCRKLYFFFLIADNWWNSPNCYTRGMTASLVHSSKNHTTTPVEEYWE